MLKYAAECEDYVCQRKQALIKFFAIQILYVYES